jgi:hypothetical protein
MTTVEDLIWQQASQTLFLTREQYLEHLRTFAIEPIERDGILIGAVMRKGPELHFTTFRAGVAIDRQLIRDVLAPQLERYGYVETRTPKPDHTRQHRFNKVVGFVKTGEDDYNVHYRLDRGRSAAHRSAPCPLPQSPHPSSL